MKYELNWLVKAFEQNPALKFLYFWGHQPAKDGQITASCFSQWWHAPFRIGQIDYPTAEHWMMARKALLFDNHDLYQKIIVSRSPGEAKALGRMVKNFDEATWVKERYAIVLEGNIEKFRQHPPLHSYLIKTGDRILAEASPVDPIWGIGLAADNPKATDPSTWNGLNLLGFALMETRDKLA